VDFGLVRNLRETSLTLSHLTHGPGTPYYASPEQLNNEKDLIDWRSDQYAVGVVLAICLTGMHPYGELSASPDNVVNKVLSRASHALSFVETVEQLGLELLLTMTSQWPVARFGKPEQAIDALRIAIERNSG
ncbi:MAG: serine/threonine protein kinase, partial [Proteobacteria bacterium]|nr:serine/threonine protein kinase [Pseudomonadota bacterium]